MKYFIILLLVFGSVNKIEAANIFTVCADYDSTGNPKNMYQNWLTQRGGNFMYIFFKADHLLTKKYRVRIEKLYNRIDTTYLLFDRFTLKNDGKKNWVANKYTFLKSGNYRFLLFEDDSETPIETYYTAISYTDETYTDDGFVDTWYYKNTEFRFCDSVSNSKLVGVKDVFKIQPVETKVTIYITHEQNKPLRTDRILAKVYNITNNEKKYVYTDVFFSEYNWQWTFLPLYLTDKGNYLVELYNEEDIFINSRKVEIQ